MKAGRCERRRSEHTERSEVCESFILIMVRFCAPLFFCFTDRDGVKSSVGVGEICFWGFGEEGVLSCKFNSWAKICCR